MPETAVQIKPESKIISDIIKDLQNFINQPFYYNELLSLQEKKLHFLVALNIIDQIKPIEYNSIFDTFGELEGYFAFGNKPNFCIGQSGLVVNEMFSWCYKQREKII